MMVSIHLSTFFFFMCSHTHARRNILAEAITHTKKYSSTIHNESLVWLYNFGDFVLIHTLFAIIYCRLLPYSYTHGSTIPLYKFAIINFQLGKSTDTKYEFVCECVCVCKYIGLSMCAKNLLFPMKRCKCRSHPENGWKPIET